MISVLGSLHDFVPFTAILYDYPSRPDFPVLNYFEAGRTVSLVGAFGSENRPPFLFSTVFYDPPSGSVNFDGVALRDLNLKLARKMSASAITHKSYCPRSAQNVRSVTNIEVEFRCIQVIHRL